MNGLFVAFEGIEGSGKSTQIRLLADSLRAEGVECLTTREPGGTSEGAALRELILARKREGPLDPLTEALLMVADRRQHVATILVPALEQGLVVLCDRFTDSTLAYQGGGSGVELSTLEYLNHLATGGLAPGLTVLFDLPVERALERVHAPARSAPDRFETEPPEFHERVRRLYRRLADARPERYAVIDATLSEAEIAREVRASFERLRARVEAGSGGG
ncbi:MAG: dTMP kinase [Candidatus Eiseniibacteriota bacterium]